MKQLLKELIPPLLIKVVKNRSATHAPLFGSYQEALDACSTEGYQASDLVQVALQYLGKRLDLGPQPRCSQVAIRGLRSDDLQAMVPSQIRNLAVYTALDVWQGAPTQDGHLVAGVVGEGR